MRLNVKAPEKQGIARPQPSEKISGRDMINLNHIVLSLNEGQSCFSEKFVVQAGHKMRGARRERSLLKPQAWGFKLRPRAVISIPFVLGPPSVSSPFIYSCFKDHICFKF